MMQREHKVSESLAGEAHIGDGVRRCISFLWRQIADDVQFEMYVDKLSSAPPPPPPIHVVSVASTALLKNKLC
jgi:hypothetical protein